MPQPTRLICSLVAEGAPAVQARVDCCCDCGCAVWRSLSSPAQPPAICFDCVRRVQQAGEPITVQPPTAKQRAALKKYFADC